jgi:hypothetical protein
MGKDDNSKKTCPLIALKMKSRGVWGKGVEIECPMA